MAGTGWGGAAPSYWENDMNPPAQAPAQQPIAAKPPMVQQKPAAPMQQQAGPRPMGPPMARQAQPQRWWEHGPQGPTSGGRMGPAAAPPPPVAPPPAANPYQAANSAVFNNLGMGAPPPPPQGVAPLGVGAPEISDMRGTMQNGAAASIQDPANRRMRIAPQRY